MRWRTQGTPPQPGRARLGGGACTAVRSGGRFPPGPAEQLGEGVPERAPSRHGSGAQGGGEPEDGPAVAGPSSVSMKERGAEGGALSPTGQRPASWGGVQPAAGSCHAPVTSHRDAVRQRREYCSYGGCRVGGAVLGYARLSSLNKEGGALGVRVAAIDRSTVAEEGAPFTFRRRRTQTQLLCLVAIGVPRRSARVWRNLAARGAGVGDAGGPAEGVVTPAGRESTR